MKKLLVTGFDPFDERGYNTSSEIFSHLPEEMAGYQLIKKMVPVEWEQGRTRLLEYCEQEKPDAIFSMGMSKNNFLQFEVLARNHRKADLTDNCNEKPMSTAICASEAATLPCTWPIPPLLPCALADTVRIEASDDAGGYLCNQTFFLGTLYATHQSPVIPVAFVHIPPKPEDGGIPLALTADGNLLLIDLDPVAFKLLDTKKVSDSSTWAHLAVCGEELFVRELKGLIKLEWPQ